jgi:hypothetical protein
MGTTTAACEHVDESLAPCGAYRRAVQRGLTLLASGRGVARAVNIGSTARGKHKYGRDVAAMQQG